MGKSDYCRYEPEVRGSVRPAQIMNIASDKSGGICKQKGHGARARASSKVEHSIVVCRKIISLRCSRKAISDWIQHLNYHTTGMSGMQSKERTRHSGDIILRAFTSQ